MIRLVGTITGSALAVALLLLVLGIPQFHAPATETERRVVTLPLPTRAVDAVEEPPAATVEANVPPPAAPVTTAVADTMPAPNGEAGLDAADGPSPPPVVPEVAEASVAPDIGEVPPRALDEPQWYSFWSPFKSEIAANGFVARLQSVTGLDYRIDRVKPGVYEVSFAYVDDEEIPVNLTQITAATGLDLGER